MKTERNFFGRAARHSIRRCSRCGERWPQRAGYLCERCFRALGGQPVPKRGHQSVEQVQAREAYILSRALKAEQQAQALVRVGCPIPLTGRTVIADGIEYETVWDGS